VASHETIELHVNGTIAHVRVDPETPLIYVLRNDLQLKGARFGCGVGMCGACTVLVDGRAVESCDVPTGSVAGRSITTIEGLARENELHPLQEAFLEEQAGQCGYCLSGILMATVALLEADASPSEAAIREALDGHLCRCGAHARILRAICRVAAAGQLAHG
jgi:nicotinate dehydrogenase subunit A